MTTRSQTPSTGPRRAVAYARVSMAREEMISPEIQLDAIRGWCAANNRDIVEEIVDRGKTGRNFNRQIQRAIEMTEGSEADDIVVWKFSRFGRTRSGWEKNLGRVEDKGGELHSASEPVDAKTAVGKFTRGLFGQLAAFESDLFSEGWKEAQSYRHNLGLPHTGTPQFGYVHHRCRDSDENRWRLRTPKDRACTDDGTCREEYRVDPVTGPVLAELYRRYLASEGLASLAAWCQSTGQPRIRGGEWYASSVSDLLDSGFGAGLLRTGIKGKATRGAHVEYLPGAQTPVIEHDVWEAYLARREATYDLHSSAKRSVWPLTGLIKCGLCGGSMTCASSARGRGYIYRCVRMQNNHQCKGVWRVRAVIENEMFAALDDVADELEAAGRRSAKTVRRQKSDSSHQRQRLQVRLEESRKERTNLVAAVARGTLEDSDVRDALATIKADQETILAELAVAAIPPRAWTPPQIRSLRTQWAELPVETARAIARLLVKSIVCHEDKTITVTLADALTGHRVTGGVKQ